MEIDTRTEAKRKEALLSGEFKADPGVDLEGCAHCEELWWRGCCGRFVCLAGAAYKTPSCYRHE